MLSAPGTERIIRAVARRVSSPIFIGRVAERAALSEALDRAIAGEPGIVLITGEAGVGKTRLVRESATGAAASGAVVLAGGCVDVAAGTLAYGPFIDIVRDLHRAGLTTGLPAVTRTELARLVPEVAPGPGRADLPEPSVGGEGRLFAAIRDALSASAASTPLLVTLEDLHWADGTTLDLITYLARSMGTERYLLVGTARVDSIGRRHPLLGLLAELARLPRFERLELVRFDETELGQQLTGILGRTPDPAMAHDVFERSDGNAFFAEELIATGTVDGRLPATLREVLAARLAALDDTTQDVIGVAAVAGPSVSHDLLEQVAGVPAPTLVDALREAVDHGVLLHVEGATAGYAFRHALVREAAADALLAAERIAIHRAVADTLERSSDPYPGGELARTGEIAYHAFAADDLPRALAASRAAADAAEYASAYAEAEMHLARILEIWPRVPDAAALVGLDESSIRSRAARAAASAGHHAEAVAYAEASLAGLRADDTERRLPALLELFDYAWEGADLATASRVVAEALPLVRDERTERNAMVHAAEAMLDWHHGRYTSSHTAATHAIEIARECGAQRALALALTHLGMTYTHLGETNHAETAFAEAATIHDVVDDPLRRAMSTRWRSWGRNQHGRFDEALALNQRGLEIARRDGVDGRFGVELLDGQLENLIELGRWPEARAIGDRILARMVRSLEMVGAYMSLGRLATLTGRFDEAEAYGIRAAGFSVAGPHVIWQLEDLILLAYATQRFADGRQLTESAIAASTEPEHDAILWWPLRWAIGGEADRAEAARRRRRAADAEAAVGAGRHFAAILRRSGEHAIAADGGSPLLRAELAVVDAELARLEGRAAPELWAVAVTARLETGQPWEVAHTRFRLGEAILSAGGRAADAASPLRDAHAVAIDLGAAPLSDAIEALAGRARITLDQAPSADPDPTPSRSTTTLSAREIEVLTLVAAGHTNREIGEQLFISEKTASVHVTHAMDKLGALSRYEAAAAATRLGLLPGDA